jgi:levansucrase
LTDNGTSRWTRRDLDRLVETPATTMPPVVAPAPHMLPHLDIWDMWPIQEPDGPPATLQGNELWMALSAPAVGHPENRHDHARIRLLTKASNHWTDLGPVFTDGTSPGSREWSGSAVRRPDGTVSTFYTAVGKAGEARPTFHQRVIEARCRLVTDQRGIHLERQVPHRAVLHSGTNGYLPANEAEGGPGRIRAFRDPGWFCDPADGLEYLLVAASVPSHGHHMGAVALAQATAGGWGLRPPLIVADGINHEIERPHIVVHESRYYLFFSTNRSAFHPPNCAPTGLYGFVATNVGGPYEPLNESGLVVRNPPTHPDQTYAWLVLSDRRVVSFINYLPGTSTDPRQAEADEARACFVGSIAPILLLTLDGATTSVSAV